MFCIWFYFMLNFFFGFFLVQFSTKKKEKESVALARVLSQSSLCYFYLKNSTVFSYSTSMQMHFSHMNMFLGWEIEMTLKILKIKCRDYNLKWVLEPFIFLEGYFLLISFFIWKHITLLLLSLIILWFSRMLRIHQFYATLEYVKVKDFEELSQSFRDDFRTSLLILSLYYFLSWYITASHPFKPIILAILS